MKATVKTLEFKDAGQIDLDDAIFAVDVKADILQRMVHFQLNKRRGGNHKTKGISEVSGTGKKPWKQKGTGSARAGTKRRPQDVGGGIIFGPVVRSHATDLPKKIRALALKMALSAKAKDNKLVIIDSATVSSHKTKPMAEALAKFGAKSVLIVGGKEIEANFARATSNIPRVDVLPSVGANVYDILRRDTLILTKDAVADLTEKLKG